MPMHPPHLPHHERASSMHACRPHGVRPVIATRHSLGALPSERSMDREAIEIAVMLRHSAPTFDRAGSPTVTAKDVPESILMRTDVHVTGVAAREGHCVYSLEVASGFEAHVIHKRYSEIRDFRTALLHTVNEKKAHCGHGPCAQIAQLAQIKFPRRRLRLPSTKTDANLVVAEARMPLLERFLQAMLRVYRMATRRQARVCTNSRCVLLGMIKRFLEVSEPMFLEQDQNRAASIDHEISKDGKGPACSEVPFSFPELAFSTLCGSMPAPLFPIAEDPEPDAAFE